jgi:hypothetical protein
MQVEQQDEVKSRVPGLNLRASSPGTIWLLRVS